MKVNAFFVIMLLIGGCAGVIIGLGSNKIERQQAYINRLENDLQFRDLQCQHKIDSLKLEIAKRERGWK